MVTHPTRPAGIRIPRSDRAFYIASYVVLTLLFLSVLYPIVFVISASFSEGRMVSAGKVILWPVHPSVEGYAAVFRNRRVLLGFETFRLRASRPLPMPFCTGASAWSR